MIVIREGGGVVVRALEVHFTIRLRAGGNREKGAALCFWLWNGINQQREVDLFYPLHKTTHTHTSQDTGTRYVNVLENKLLLLTFFTAHTR
jgi:hypothetical protein